MNKILALDPSILPSRNNPGPNSYGGGQPWARTLCAALLALSVGQAAEAAPGDLDPSFDGDGRVLTPFGAIDGVAPGSQEFPSAVALQADGKLVVAGNSFSADFGSGNLALARYNPDGSLDLSFGSGGRVLSAFEAPSDPPSSLAIQPDGKLLLANRSLSFVDDLPRVGVSLNRFRPDGGVDENFGSGGRLIVDVSSVDFFSGPELVVLPNGKLVAGGGAFSPGAGGVDFALVRFNTDGSLDPSFGSGGKVLTDFTEDSDDTISKFLIQPDGKLVAVGMSSSFSADFVEKREVALARFNPDGSLDPSFGAGGRLLLDLGGDPSLSTLTLQPDGKLVALMSSSGSRGLGPFVDFLVRFSADGSLDATFGSGGLAQITFSLTFGTFLGSLAVQSDGKLVVAGSSSPFGFTRSLIVLFRINADGSLDPGFGSGGQVLTSLDGRQLSSNNSASVVVVQSDGKLVVIGTSDAGGDADFALVRYLVTNERPAQPPRCGGRRATMIGTPANDTLRGTLFGRDVILGLGGNDTIRGLGGEDILCGGRGNDMLIGGDDSDRLHGGPGNDRLFGDLGLDSVDGDDALFGGPGRDTLVGAGGSDSLFGERDNDRLFGDAEQDTLDGGDGGRDRCRGGLGRDTTTGCEFGAEQRPTEPPRDPVPNPCPVGNAPGCSTP